MPDEQKTKGVPKQRLDALTDGVFAFAMTLLVISLDLPAGVKVADAAGLIALLGQLQDTLLVYVISFTVLGARWIRNARGRDTEMWCSTGYAWAVLLHLFFVTLVPFTTKLVGLYGDLWPAVWIYGANTLCAALSSRRAADLLVRQGARPGPAGDRIDLRVLVLTVVLSGILAVLVPGTGMYAYLLNGLSPLLHRRRQEREPG